MAHEHRGGERRPDFDDVRNEVFGNTSLFKKGLVARMEEIDSEVEAVQESIEALDAKLGRILERATWLLIGLGINLASNVPDAFSWLLSRLTP